MTNPGDRAIIMSAFEGQDYTIDPGGSLEVESERAALTLVDYGAHLDPSTRLEAIEVEGNRTPDERLAVVTARTAAGKSATTSTDLSADPSELKGKALDAALKEAGLDLSGKADEKRARLAEHRKGVAVVVEEHDGSTVDKVVTPDGVQSDAGTGAPATPGGTIVEGVTAAGDVGPFDPQNAPVVLPAVDPEHA